MRSDMSRHSTIRSLATSEQLQQDLTKIIQQELRDPRISSQDKLGLNITAIRVSRDLAIADVLVSFMPLPESAAANPTKDKPNTQSIADKRKLILQILRTAAGFLRSRIAKSNSMHSVPNLKFHYDESLEQSARLAMLLAERNGQSAKEA